MYSTGFLSTRNRSGITSSAAVTSKFAGQWLVHRRLQSFRAD